MNMITNDSIDSLAKAIRLVILDVDGVLTNGELFFFDSGEYKAFNARDGLGIALLLKSGINLAVISGNRSESVQRRLAGFGIKHIYQGVKNKVTAYENILADLQLSASSVAYMGDDLIDLPVMQRVALPTAVADADDFVKQQAKWVATCNGGQGAVRELCELILSAQGKLAGLRQTFMQ